jgi:AcrR family transcriptional regulator
MSSTTTGRPERRSQAERRERTRDALLEAAARGLSRYGYGNLVLERVASDAGYTRGALYHQFTGKQELALAVVEWVERTWHAHMSELLGHATDPAEMLCGIARAHAVYCRRDVARVMMSLRVELSGQDHPVGRAVEAATSRVVADTAALITAGRESGAIPPGPPPEVLARAVVGAIEGLVIELSGQAPYDELLAERAMVGLLGLPIPTGHP